MSVQDEADIEKKMLAIESIIHGISMAAKIIQGTNLNLGDLLVGQIAIWCSDESNAEDRAEEFGRRLLAMVHADIAARITGQQKMLELFQEEGVEVKYRH